VFSVDEMIQLFDIAAVNKSASCFNTGKLDWLNQQYLINSDPAHVARYLSVHLGKLGIDPAPAPDLVDVVMAQRERAHTLVELAEISAFYYRDFEQYEEKAAAKALKAAAVEPLTHMKQALAELPDWNREAIHAAMEGVVEQLGVGFGKVGMPLRVAVTGGAPSPDLDLTLWLVGRAACLRRIDKALAHIGQHAS
jgi:glutamyl-tRNA synthetase